MTDAGPPPSDPDAADTSQPAAAADPMPWIAPNTEPAMPPLESDLPPGWAPADAPGYESNAFPQGTFGPSGYSGPDYDPVPHPSEIYGYQPPPTYANPLMAHKPGVVPLRPLTAADILSGSFAAITTNFRTVAPISAAFAIVSAAIGLLVSAMAQSVAITDDTALGALGGLATFGTAASVFLAALLTGALAYPTSRAVEGRYPPLKRSWERLRPRLPAALSIAGIVFALIAVPLILVTAIFAAAGSASSPVLAVLGALLGVVAAVALTAITTFIAFSMPITVLEGLGPMDALRRSVILVRPVFWRVLGTLLLVAMIVAIIHSVITSPTGDINRLTEGISGGAVATTTKLLLSTLLTAVAAFVTMPFLATAVTLLYTDARVRLEGFDVALIAGSPTTPAGPA